MAGGVEQLDDLAVFDDRVRDKNRLAETTGDSLGNRRFAVSWRAIDEHPFARIDRRSQSGQAGPAKQGCRQTPPPIACDAAFRCGCSGPEPSSHNLPAAPAPDPRTHTRESHAAPVRDLGRSADTRDRPACPNVTGEISCRDPHGRIAIFEDRPAASKDGRQSPDRSPSRLPERYFKTRSSISVALSPLSFSQCSSWG